MVCMSILYEYEYGAEFWGTPADQISLTKIFERLIFSKKFTMTFS